VLSSVECVMVWSAIRELLLKFDFNECMILKDDSPEVQKPKVDFSRNE